MTGERDAGPDQETRAARRLLAALVGQRDHREIDGELLSLVNHLAEVGRVADLAVLFGPMPGRWPDGYLLRAGVSGGWDTADAQRYDDPAEVWSAFRRSRDGIELVAIGAAVERRIAVRQGGSAVRFLDIDALALDGPGSEAALREWERVAPHASVSASFVARATDAVEPSGAAGVVAAADMSLPDGIDEVEPEVRRPPESLVDPVVEPLADPATEPAVERPADERAVDELSQQFSDDFYGARDRRPPISERVRGLERWKFAYAGLALVALAMVFVFIRFTLDDSFITWRYGHTFVHSGHWNWNATGPRVEAYTNALYAIVSIIPAFLRIPVELFFKLVSLAIIGAFVVVVRRLGLSRRQEFLLLAVALASPVFYLQLFGGLETASFALLIALLYGMLYRHGRLDVWGYVVAGALALSRPEGIAFAGVAMVWALLIDRRPTHSRGLFWVCAGWVVYWLWRWQHFGWFFPNPYYGKAIHGGSASHKVVDAVTSLSPVLALAAIAGLVAVLFVQRVDGPKRPRAERLQDATPFVLAVLSSVIVLGLYKHADLVMDPAHRFYWQLLFPVALVGLCRPLAVDAFGGVDTGDRYAGRDLGALLGIGVAMATVVAWQPIDTKTGLVSIAAALVVLGAALARAVWRTGGAAGVAAIALAVGVGYLGTNEAIGWLAYRYRLESAHQALGTVLADAHVKGGVTMFDAGVLPYLLDTRVIDTGGLANAQVEHGGLTTDALAGAHVEVVILGFASPALSERFFGGRGATVAFAYARAHQFWSSAGVMFDHDYFLNYFMSPELAATGLPAKINRVTQSSVRDNSRSDTDIVLDNLWSFPFLH